MRNLNIPKNLSLEPNMVVVLFNVSHSPLTRLTGITYAPAPQSIDDDYLTKLMGAGYVALHISYLKYYFPCNVKHDTHESAGYALISKDNVKKMASVKRVTAKTIFQAETVLFEVISHSYIESK